MKWYNHTIKSFNTFSKRKTKLFGFSHFNVRILTNFLTKNYILLNKLQLNNTKSTLSYVALRLYCFLISLNEWNVEHSNSGHLKSERRRKSQVILRFTPNRFNLLTHWKIRFSMFTIVYALDCINFLYLICTFCQSNNT